MSSSDSKPFVTFENVWLAYNEELLAQNQFAVEDINLNVQDGEFIAIVGPSGCGKSTFMKLTTGLNRPTKGRITVGGEEVNGPLKISGMAFQAPSLLPWRTTLDNVLLPLEIVEPYRSQFSKKKRPMKLAPLPCLKEWVWVAMRESTRGNCLAACSSAQAFVERSSMSPKCFCSMNPLAL